MLEEVRSAVATLEAAVRALTPGDLDGPGALRVLELFAKGERLCAAGKAISAKRVDETGVWRRSGEPSAAHLLATKTGVGIGSGGAGAADGREARRAAGHR